jgi:hypothetical protein
MVNLGKAIEASDHNLAPVVLRKWDETSYLSGSE